MTDARPPRLTTWMLRRLLPPGVRGDTILGDLIEEHARGRSRWWYRRQAWSLAIRYARQRVGRHDAEPSSVRPPQGTVMLLDNLARDVRYAIRSYAKTPSFTMVLLTTIALGIGASTAIFSLVNGILLRPLPLADPDRLVYANETNARGQMISISWPNFVDWRARARSFTQLAASREEALTWNGRDRAERLTVRRATANFFDVLQVRPYVGRTFVADDDRPSGEPVAVLSDGFWRRGFGADRSVLGRPLVLDGVAYTIVGVLPAGFKYLQPYDAFLSIGPIAAQPVVLDRGNHTGFSAVGRLAAAVSVESANRELRTIASDLEREHPNTNSAIGVRAELLSTRLVANVRPMLLALLGAVGFLLLVACVNVANLLVSRGASRQQELAIRTALGGGRLRLVSQLLVESLLLSVSGAALGLAVAWWLLRALLALAPDGTPRLEDVSLDAAAVAFALVAAIACGLVFGAFPAFQASGVHGPHLLVRSRASATPGAHRMRRALMMVEVALALVLLTGAGLMIRTLQELARVETGFVPDHLLTVRMSLAGEQWTPDRRVPFYDELLARVRALPEVKNAALAFSLPIDGSNWNSVFVASDKPIPRRSELPSAAFSPVSSGYFETLGMRLVRGRFFGPADTATSPPTVVISEGLARRIWPGEDPVGRRLKQGWPESPTPWREIVGVVADVKFEGVSAETPLQVYLPIDQESTQSFALVVRTATDSTRIQPVIEERIHAVDKTLPLYQARTMDQILNGSIARERISALILSVFAVVALTLAGVGLYGVVAHGVSERTHEIGVRMALGADAAHVLALVVRQGLVTAIAGIVVGTAGALVISRAIRGLLFGITPGDPGTYAAVASLLLAVAFLACYIPARRATRLDPSAALRSE